MNRSLLLSATVLVLLCCSSCSDAMSSTQGHAPLNELTGEFEVSYTVHKSPTSTSSRSYKVNRIVFRDHYVILQTKAGGVLLPVGSLTSLEWQEH